MWNNLFKRAVHLIYLKFKIDVECETIRFTCYYNHIVVAALTIHLDSNLVHARFRHLYVEPEWQNRKIGSRLMEMGVKWCAENRITSAEIRPKPPNTYSDLRKKGKKINLSQSELENFYRRFGFEFKDSNIGVMFKAF